METSNKLYSPLTLALFILLSILTSCSNDESDPLINCPECVVIERTDIEISGEMAIHDFEQSIQEDAALDLVTYNYHGDPSVDFDYLVALSNGYELIIRVHDAANTNPWEQVNQPYNIYPQSELENKLMYTTIELRTSANEPLYSSNLNGTSPPATYLDVFRVVKFDGLTLQARIRDVVLYKYNNANKEVIINGTFIGAVTFE